MNLASILRHFDAQYGETRILREFTTLAPQEHGDERSALPLFSINAATQRAGFFGQPWDLVIPEA